MAPLVFAGAPVQPGLLKVTYTTSPGTTFTYVWRYANEPLLAKITIVATGQAGRSEQVAFNVFHR